MSSYVSASTKFQLTAPFDWMFSSLVTALLNDCANLSDGLFMLCIPFDITDNNQPTDNGPAYDNEVGKA
jgi:hypothetical protein